MRKTYRLSLEAEEDLSDIWSHIAFASEDPAIADRFILRLESVFPTLFTFPRKGESRDYIVLEFRKWTFGNYIIYYTIQDDYVRIERVLGGRQDQDRSIRRGR